MTAAVNQIRARRKITAPRTALSTAGMACVIAGKLVVTARKTAAGAEMASVMALAVRIVRVARKTAAGVEMASVIAPVARLTAPVQRIAHSQVYGS